MEATKSPTYIPRRVFFIIATGFGLSSSVQGFLLMLFKGERLMGAEWLLLPVLNLTYWYVPALLAPVIMRIAARYQLGRTSWWTQIAVHVTGVMVYSLIHTPSMIALRALFAWISDSQRSTPDFWSIAGVEYMRQFDWQLMTYLFLVGLAHALVYRRESEQRALDASRLETRLVEAQLQALQRQLHPHFLFNTLNTIAGLIRTNVNAADIMIDQLGDLLRMALNTSGRQEVPLKQELEVLGKYLDIEQTRFGSRLRVHMRIDPETLDAEVPTLLLQPLVENAIRHGISPHSRAGWIAVDAVRQDDRLILRVRDNGYGVPPERLLALNSGVGLANTRARLEHLYRRSHQFTFSNVDDGFCVTIAFPFRTTPMTEPAGIPVEAA